MRLDARTASLVAVGASVAANCQPCLAINAARAGQHGAEPLEVAAAIEIGRKVRAGAAAKLDAFVTTLAAAPGAPEPACGCAS